MVLCALLLPRDLVSRRRTKPRHAGARIFRKKNCPLSKAGWATGRIGQGVRISGQSLLLATLQQECSCRRPSATPATVDCTVIGKGEAEWSLRDNIVRDSCCCFYCLVQNVLKPVHSRMVLRGWDHRESSASLLQPYHHNNVRHDEFAHRVRHIHKALRNSPKKLANVT